MKSLILHIPHSSVNFPNREGYLLSQYQLEQEILELTDWHTDDLFSVQDAIILKADFSRIFCDVERFADDAREEMAQFGMGVLYEKTDEGRELRRVSPELRDTILREYYYPHHKQLEDTVAEQLKTYGKALILDCHSFPNIPLIRDFAQSLPRPDFNIGTHPFHTPKTLIEQSIRFFRERNYTLGIDWPYDGTMVPLAYLNKNSKVQSIMLEVNRKLYMESSTNKKTENYPVIKEVVGEYIELLKSCL